MTQYTRAPIFTFSIANSTLTREQLEAEALPGLRELYTDMATAGMNATMATLTPEDTMVLATDPYHLVYPMGVLLEAAGFSTLEAYSVQDHARRHVPEEYRSDIDRVDRMKMLDKAMDIYESLVDNNVTVHDAIAYLSVEYYRGTTAGDMAQMLSDYLNKISESKILGARRRNAAQMLLTGISCYISTRTEKRPIRHALNYVNGFTKSLSEMIEAYREEMALGELAHNGIISIIIEDIRDYINDSIDAAASTHVEEAELRELEQLRCMLLQSLVDSMASNYNSRGRGRHWRDRVADRRSSRGRDDNNIDGYSFSNLCRYHGI